MATGFFLGGMADARESRLQRALEADRLAADTSLRERGLGLQERQLDAETAFRRDDLGLRRRALSMQERQMQSAASQEMAARADAAVAETMKIVTQAIDAGMAAGRDPQQIRAAVAPLLADAQEIAGMAGRDPARLGLMVDTMLAGPGAAEMATATGRTTAAGMLGQAAGLQAGGIDQARAEATAGIEGGGGGGGGVSGEALGRITMLKTGQETAKTVAQQMLRPDGSVDRGLIVQMLSDAPFGLGGPGIPGTQGRAVRAQLMDALQSKLRLETGAAAPASEVQNLLDRFMPSLFDSDEQIKDKMKRLERFFEVGLSLTEPGIFDRLVERAAGEGTPPPAPPAGEQGAVFSGYGADGMTIFRRPNGTYFGVATGGAQAGAGGSTSNQRDRFAGAFGG